MKTFCLDTETSAWSRDGRIVQVAIVDESYREEWLVNPESYIEPGCIAVHKITPDMVADKPNFKNSDAYIELGKRLENDEVLIAHHAPFDTAILANEGVHIDKFICTCKVARKILKPDWVPKFWLQFLKDYLDLESLNSHDTLTGYAHSALYDTIVLYWLYKYLYEKIEQRYPGEDPNEVMYSITHDIIPMKIFKFWKYKWRTLVDVANIDRGYLHWLYESEMKHPPAKRKSSLIAWLLLHISVEETERTS